MVQLADNTGNEPVVIPSRGGVSPIGTVSPNTGSTANTNSTYGQGAFASGITEQTSATAYTLQNTDYQGVIIFNTNSAVSVTLNSGVQSNFQATILNLGTGAITITPTGGFTVNGLSSLTLASGQGVQVFFANRAWLAYAGTTALPAAILVGTTGSLGGSAMTAGQTVTATATVTGATTAMVAVTSPVTNPGAGFVWDAYVSAANTVTVALTCVAAGTPSAGNYNVRVIQ